jgi:prolyl oligopeptidase
MKRLRFSPGLFMAACLLPAALHAEAQLDYPKTATVNVVDKPFGEVVADPYRWLENDVRNDPKVRDWVTAQNKVSGAYLASLPGRDVLEKRLRELFAFERMGVPFKAGARTFYARNTGLQNQSTLWVREGRAERLLIDPNLWAKDGAAALAEWLPTEDGRLLAYTVQDGGTDWRTIRVLDVATGKLLDDEVRWVKFSRLAWARDGRGFFYSRFPEPKEGGTFQSLNLNQSIWYHAVGTLQSADVQIYATPAQPKLNHSAEVTDDGRWLVISSSAGTDPRNAVTLVSLAKVGSKPRALIPGIENDWQLVGAIGNRMWFRTDKDAAKGRIVRIDVGTGKAKPVAIVPETADTLIGASMVGSHLIVAYLGDAKSQAERFSLEGKPMGTVELPGIGTAAGFGGRYGERESFYTFSSFASPPTIYRYDSDTNRSEPFFSPKVAFDPAAYVTEQAFFPSKDGTPIPMFIVKRRDLSKGAAPTLLYGYGGFNVSLTPSFSATRIAWLEQGGVLAVANLRGGGEYGKNWHDAGRLARKQNVFDDFIAAGEYLIAKGVTAKDKLAIQGGSNGGLLVGAVVNQRPDLFAAALPAVGVMDMLRFDQFTAGRYWVDDYGNPSVEADWRLLRSYSPYHNIKAGVDYPAVLVTTADTDDRVVPGHSFKYTAALQAAKAGPKPHIIRIETRAGHGSGKPTDKIIESAADEWAFVAKWTGMTVR